MKFWPKLDGPGADGVVSRGGSERRQRDAAIRFRCPVCGKLTAGRLPRNSHNHREVGDGTFYHPRRHKGANGLACPGNIEEAEWVTIKKTTSA